MQNNTEVINKLKSLYGCQTDVALSEFLGVTKQSIWQYKKGDGEDIKAKIIRKLLNIENKIVTEDT